MHNTCNKDPHLLAVKTQLCLQYFGPSPADSEEGLLIGTREKFSQESTLKNEKKVPLEKILYQN
jgi:hypothetical protein